MTLKKIGTITKKELKDFLISPYSYIIALFFIISINYIFFFGDKNLFLQQEASLKVVFQALPLIFAIAIPALTMRSWAEEKNQGTLELIMTLPYKASQLIIGKFLATWIFVAFLLLLSIGLPITLGVIGSPDWGLIVSNYLAALLLAASLIGIGQFVSINTDSQLLSFIIALAISGTLFFIGTNTFLKLIPASTRSLVEYLSTSYHFNSFTKGVINSKNIIYFLTLLLISWLLTYKSYLSIKIKGR